MSQDNRHSPGQRAILFTDIEGSSRLTAKLGDARYRAEVLEPHFVLVRSLLEAANGYEGGDPAGDSFFALFDLPDEALPAAMKIQREMQSWSDAHREQIGQEVKVRIGVHYSEKPLVYHPELHFSGHSDVNFAARVESIGAGGQIVVSRQCRTACTLSDLDWKEWPDRRIRSFEEGGVAVYTLGWGGADEHREPGAARVPRWYSESNRYIPRPEAENRVVDSFKKTSMDRPARRLVTIHGFGGAGKTRLALRCCLLMAPLFEGRVYPVRLDGLSADAARDGETRAALLAGAIADAFDLKAEARLPQNLPDSLPSKSCLLLLDNYETAACVESRNLITALIEKRPELTVLATGRSLVNNPNLEFVFDIERLTSEQSEALFTDRARMRFGDNNWNAPKEQTPYLKEILSITEGLPLSLELTAAQVRDYSLREIAEGLRRTLVGDMAALPKDAGFGAGNERHESLWKCLTWSWNLLTEADRQALLCLSLFEAPFTREEAAECSRAALPGVEDTTTTAPLVDASCLTRLRTAALLSREETPSGASRFRLHTATRQYAGVKRGSGPEAERYIQPFIAYWVHQMRLYREGATNHDMTALSNLDTVYRNAMAAFHLAVQRESLSDADTLHETLAWRFQWRASYAEHLILSQALLELQRRKLPAAHADIANSLTWIATMYMNQGRYAEAELLYQQALQIRRAVLPEGHPDAAGSLNNLAELYRSQGRYTEAELLYLQVVEIYRAALPEEHPNIAMSLNNLAELYRNLGRYAEAEPLYQQALKIKRKALPGGHPSVATSLNNLALLYDDQGRYAEAEPLYQQALQIRRAVLPVGHPDIAQSLNNLAALYRSQGRYTEAELLYLQVVEIYRAALPEEHPNIATSLNNLAELYRNLGRYAEAEPLYQQALEILSVALPSGHPGIALSFNNLALLYFGQSRYEDAEPPFQQAVAIMVKALGEDHPKTRTVVKNYRRFLEAKSRG